MKKNNVVSINQGRVDKMRLEVMSKNVDDEVKITMLKLLDLCLHIDSKKAFKNGG